MSYTATWANANEQGRVVPAEHFVRDDDPGELAAAVNRRRLLVYLPEQDFSWQIGPLKSVRAATFAGQGPPPFTSLRDAVAADILSPAVGGLGGQPPTPAGMDWLWPVPGADENKVLVGSNPSGDQVGLMEQLNGTADWTGQIVELSDVRAVHVNELRQAIEWIVRGRWRLPVYFSAGILSLLPDTPWIGGSIANSGADELRSLGFVVGRTGDQPPLGLTNVTVRPATRLLLTADADCQVELYRCLRPIDFVDDRPTWNQYAPAAELDWSSPGGAGSGDATLIGALALSAEVAGEVSGAAMTEAVQAMLDGQEQNWLVRRSDTGYPTIGISGELVVEFDLNSPGN